MLTTVHMYGFCVHETARFLTLIFINLTTDDASSSARILYFHESRDFQFVTRLRNCNALGKNYRCLENNILF